MIMESFMEDRRQKLSLTSEIQIQPKQTSPYIHRKMNFNNPCMWWTVLIKYIPYQSDRAFDKYTQFILDSIARSLLFSLKTV